MFIIKTLEYNDNTSLNKHVSFFLFFSFLLGKKKQEKRKEKEKKEKKKRTVQRPTTCTYLFIFLLNLSECQTLLFFYGCLWGVNLRRHYREGGSSS